jgi:hypothetical protein
VYENMPQGNKTDFQLLKYLASLETDGSFRVFVKGDTIFFNKIDLKQNSQKTFTYGDPNGGFISFRVNEKEGEKSVGSKSVTISTTNEKTGETVKAKVDNTNSKDDTKLGDYTVFVNARGEEEIKQNSTKKEVAKEEGKGKKINAPVADDNEAVNLANHLKKKESLNDVTANLTIEMDPTIEPDSIITIAGVPDEDSGNYYVNEVTHSISAGSAATTTLGLQRNAKNIKTGATQKGAKNKNGTTGDNNEKDKVETYQVDSFGKITKQLK